MKTKLLLLGAVATIALVGCAKKHDHDHDHAGHGHHGHDHVAPHGGTVVVLGDEAFHLEFVRDAAAGTLTGYVLDAHLENFIRLAAPEMVLIAIVNGAPQSLSLFAVANPATGETQGDSSEFVGQADWLKTTPEFEAVLATITVRGVTFSDVRFHFPRGNEVE